MEYSSITYSLSKNDFKKFFYIVLKKSTFLTTVFDFVLVLLLWKFFLSSKATVLNKCTLIIIIVTFIVYFINAFIKTRGKFFENPYLIGKINLEFKEEAIILTQKNLIMKIKWADLEYVVFGKQYIYIVDKSRSIFAFIPTNTFSSEKEISLLKNDISKKVTIKRR